MNAFRKCFGDKFPETTKCPKCNGSVELTLKDCLRCDSCGKVFAHPLERIVTTVHACDCGCRDLRYSGYRNELMCKPQFQRILYECAECGKTVVFRRNGFGSLENPEVKLYCI